MALTTVLRRAKSPG